MLRPPLPVARNTKTFWIKNGTEHYVCIYNVSDARSITVGFLGVLFPLSCVEEPPTLAPLRAGTLALTKEKITTLAKHDTY